MSTRANDGSFWGDIGDEMALDRYQTLVNTIDDGIYQLDSQGRFVAVNDVIVETTGYSREDLIGEYASSLIADDDLERIGSEILSQLKTEDEDIATFELGIQTADGDAIPCELRINVLIEDGEFRGTIGIVRDISKRKRRLATLESVQASYNSMTNILDEAEIGVFVIDEEFEIAWASETIERYFGLDRDAVIGRDKRQVVREFQANDVVDSEWFAETVLATYDDSGATEQFECRITAGDGREAHWLEHYSKPIESGPYAGGRIELYYDITDRKRSEDALEETEEQFQTLVDTVQEYAIFRLDSEGNVISWNEGAKKIKGYDSEEILGNHFSTFYTEADRAAGIPERNLERATETGSLEDEGWRVRKDGAKFWANVTITAIRDDDGTHRGYLKVTRDTTDQHEREQQLESELQRILGRISDAFYAVDDDFRFTHVNERAEELLQHSEDELLGESLWEVFPAVTELEEVHEAFQTALYEQAATSLEFYAETHEIWIEANLYPSETGISVYFQDVTERKGRERELMRYETFVETVNDGIYTVDVDGHFTMVNDAYCALTGYSRDELLGSHVSLVVDEETIERAIEMERGMVDGSEEVPILEAEILTADGGRVPAEATFSMLPGDAGERIGVVRDITEQKASEQELERFKRAVEASGHAIYMTDADGMITYANPAFEETTGYTAEEAMGEMPNLLRSGEHDDAYYQRLWETVRAGDVWDEEIIDRRKNGELYYAEQTIAPVTDADGDIDRYVAVQNDITERKERERRLSTLVDNVPGMVYRSRSEPGWPMEFVSDACRELTGYAPEMLADGEINYAQDIMLDADRDDVWGEVRRALGERESFSVTYRIETADGDIRWVRSRGRGVFDDKADLLMIEGIVSDITDQKRRERTLERRARQQQTVADLGQFALESDDLDELMQEATRRVADALDHEYCKVLELDPAVEELLLRCGVGWKDGLIGEATVSAVDANSQAAYTLDHDHPIVVEDLETETRFSGPDLPTNHDVKSGISTVIGPFDEPWGILGTHDTVSRIFTEEDVNFVQSIANVLAEAIERRRYQQELEQLVADLEESNERLEQFAYAASHDLQEPLRMVSSYLQMIENRYADALDEDGREFLEFAVDGADRMREMINGLLAYSRVETRGESFEPVDLNDVLAEVLEDLQVTIEENNAEITADTLPDVRGDPNQLRQVFQNLLKNSIQYSGDEPPWVEIFAERDRDRWIVSVRDEGEGIDPRDTDRIFEVFQRLHTHEEQPGTGIGLALCKRIVERHDGEIWVDSVPGEGTTFSFSLPIRES